MLLFRKVTGLNSPLVSSHFVSHALLQAAGIPMTQSEGNKTKLHTQKNSTLHNCFLVIEHICVVISTV